jgi:hypothetical protein
MSKDAFSQIQNQMTANVQPELLSQTNTVPRTAEILSQAPLEITQANHGPLRSVEAPARNAEARLASGRTAKAPRSLFNFQSAIQALKTQGKDPQAMEAAFKNFNQVTQSYKLFDKNADDLMIKSLNRLINSKEMSRSEADQLLKYVNNYRLKSAAYFAGHFSRELLHNDISPRNIIVNKNGELALIDLGMVQDISNVPADNPELLAGLTRGDYKAIFEWSRAKAWNEFYKLKPRIEEKPTLAMKKVIQRVIDIEESMGIQRNKRFFEKLLDKAEPSAWENLQIWLKDNMMFWRINDYVPL